MRAEFEYEIPLADGRKMLTLCSGALIEKVRVCHGPWEIDRFLGRLFDALDWVHAVTTQIPDPRQRMARYYGT